MITITKDDAFKIVDIISKGREIIFCKDCIHWREYKLEGFGGIGECYGTDMDMTAEDFCSRGERAE